MPVLRAVSSDPIEEEALQLKAEVEAALEPVLKVLDRITTAGLEATFNLGPGPRGNQVITMLKVSKVY